MGNLRPGNGSGKSGSIVFGAILLPCRFQVIGVTGVRLLIGFGMGDIGTFWASNNLVNTVIFIRRAVEYKRSKIDSWNSKIPVYMKLTIGTTTSACKSGGIIKQSFITSQVCSNIWKYSVLSAGHCPRIAKFNHRNMFYWRNAAAAEGKIFPNYPLWLACSLPLCWLVWREDSVVISPYT